MTDVLLDALLDTLKLFPWLFFIYFVIELLEHKTKIGSHNRLNGRFGPLLGAATGLIPQCGFSVMAAKLFEQKYITVGTLLAIFLSTSDEAFILLLSSGTGAVWLLPLMTVKIFIGTAVGYACDGIVRAARRPRAVSSRGAAYDKARAAKDNEAIAAEKFLGEAEKNKDEKNGEKCVRLNPAPAVVYDPSFRPVAADDRCDGGGGDVGKEGETIGDGRTEERNAVAIPAANPSETKEIFLQKTGEAEFECTSCGREHDEHKPFKTYFLSPLLHSLKIAAFILAVNLILGTVIFYVTEKRFTDFMESRLFLQPVITSLVGLIPNCASSVVITECFLQGGISFGSCAAGLCANAGLGFVVLLRNTKKWKRNLALVAVCYVISLAAGLTINAVSLLF